jgi:ketosteroid isomerase-like protein
MSQENVELVRNAFRAFSAGGLEAVLRFFAPDCVWHPTDRWPEDPAYRGHEGMRKLGAAFSENFDRWGHELRRTRDAGDQVIALSEMSGQIKDSGDPISQAIVLVVADFRDETFGEVRGFATWREALEAGDSNGGAKPCQSLFGLLEGRGSPLRTAIDRTFRVWTFPGLPPSRRQCRQEADTSRFVLSGPQLGIVSASEGRPAIGRHLTRRRTPHLIASGFTGPPTPPRTGRGPAASRKSYRPSAAHTAASASSWKISPSNSPM